MLLKQFFVSIAISAVVLSVAAVTTVAQDSPYPPSLRGMAVPEPPTIGEYIRSRSAAIALGKSLFWDANLGSDGQTACASCHAHAGVDPRRTNAVNPGANGTFDAGVLPGQTKGIDFFPTVVFENPRSRFSTRLRNIDDVVGSQGVLKRVYRELVSESGILVELCEDTPDPVFHDAQGNVRQVTGRNSPSVINAVLNVRNFWDGRANALFNGVNGSGPLDPAALVWRHSNETNVLEPVSVLLEKGSLASQAVGPVLSSVEMSCSGKMMSTLAHRLLDRRALDSQRVSPSDSVLGKFAMPDGMGLFYTYRELIDEAFLPEWHTTLPTPDGIPQVESNFGLFFGLAIQMYEATLVSDDSRYDRWAAAGGPVGGDEVGLLTPQERRGLDIFVNEGTLPGVPVASCINCHASSAFSSATWTYIAQDPDATVVEIMASAAIEEAARVVFADYPIEEAPAALPLDFILDNAIVELFRIVPEGDEGDEGDDDFDGDDGEEEKEFILVSTLTLPDLAPLGCPTDVSVTGVVSKAKHGSAFSALVRRRLLSDGSCGTSMFVNVTGFLEGSYEVRVNGIARAISEVQAPGAYDLGFYNIGVRPTAEDLGVGGLQAGGIPLSFTRRIQQGLAIPDAPTSVPHVPADIHAQVDGAFKTPSIRNVELTGPYFHNGGQSTLRQVVEFYNRGGDFHQENLVDLSPEISTLDLSESDIDAVVAFMKTLTDERVREESAPFDHPELPQPDGDTLPAIGAEGRTADCWIPLQPFDYYFTVPTAPPDCDGDGRIDSCAIAADPSLDVNQDGILDSCVCVGDIVVDGYIDAKDLGTILVQWGHTGSGLAGDVNRDEVVDGNDLGLLMGLWGACGS